VYEVVIRAAELTDAEAIQEIFNQPKAQANTLQLPWRSVGQRRDWLSRVTADGHVLVAEVDGRIVGQLGLQIQGAPRRRDVGSFGMAVHDAFQGRGIGTALMQAMIELADNWLGLRRIELEVYTDNAAGVRLYEKFGFVIEGTGRAWAWRGGELVDVYFMARLKP
jgi:L-phenylalanine/L-methionine N-acetyltransferase